jgi:hypothetical protein
MKTIDSPCIVLTAPGDHKPRFIADRYVHIAFFNENENRTIAIIKTLNLNRSGRKEAIRNITRRFRGLPIKATYCAAGADVSEFWKDNHLTN